MQTDFLIIGQGICGSFLSRDLLKAGRKVIVIDDNKPDSASRVASGIINPVTGRRVVRTWMIEELLPFAQNAYEEFGDEMGKTLAREIDLLTFHTTEQMSSAWHERIAEGEDYIQQGGDVSTYSRHFEVSHGVGVTPSCLLVDVQTLLHSWREELKAQGILREERFDLSECSVSEESVTYKGIEAKKIIFCNGVGGFDNPYFKKLPFAVNKGEALILSIPGLPQTNIYKQGMSIVPIGDELFWVGSSFEWSYDDEGPTDQFRQKAESVLKNWLKLPYTILEHKSAIRPASIERRPFVGLHPIYKHVGIFNGMGTKGCSLAPYFSCQLTRHLLMNDKINEAADVKRFSRLLIG